MTKLSSKHVAEGNLILEPPFLSVWLSTYRNVHSDKARCPHTAGERMGVGLMLLLGGKQTFETKPNPLNTFSQHFITSVL